MARQAPEDGAARQTSLKEKQLSEMRRMRKDADEHHQAMLNRIGFLKSEEAKLDRDIEAAKRRALELLSRKAEKLKDDDVVSTAKDIMEAVGPGLTAAKGLRPTTGRSSLRTSGSLPSTPTIPVGALSSLALGASTSSPKLRSSSAQRAARTSSAGQPLKPTKPSPSSPAAAAAAGAAAAGPAASKRPPLPDSAPSGSPRPPAAAGLPPRPDVPLGLPPRTESQAGMPPRPASNETKRRKSPKHAVPPAPTAASPSNSNSNSHPASVGSASVSGMQQLDAGSGSCVEAAALLSRQAQQQHGGLNRMDTLGAGSREDADAELIEELIAGSSAAERQQQQQHLQGLHQFSSESAPRVVHVKTARSKQQDGASSSAVVMAAGVGWGLAPPPGSGGSAAMSGVGVVAEGAERMRLQQELVKKRQLRGVRKAFGLQPTQLQDSSAQVVECGAGSWQ